MKFTDGYRKQKFAPGWFFLVCFCKLTWRKFCPQVADQFKAHREGTARHCRVDLHPCIPLLLAVVFLLHSLAEIPTSCPVICVPRRGHHTGAGGMSVCWVSRWWFAFGVPCSVPGDQGPGSCCYKNRWKPWAFLTVWKCRDVKYVLFPHVLIVGWFLWEFRHACKRVIAWNILLEKFQT